LDGLYYALKSLVGHYNELVYNNSSLVYGGT